MQPALEAGASLPTHSLAPDERELVARYAPRILLDRCEPFRPLVVGYTLFRQDGYSPSFPRCIGLRPVGRPPAVLAIEYAIWWDWDIEHLYELEHIWTYVGADGEVVHAEGSWHGDFWSLRHWENGHIPLYAGTHPLAYAQPGKHAFAATEMPFQVMARRIQAQCLAQTPKDGLLITPIFEGVLDGWKTPEADARINAYLTHRAFEPAFVWDEPLDLASAPMVPWPLLERWIPQRIAWLLSRLERGEPL